VNYGRLTVLGERGQRGGHRLLLVRCACGSEKEIDKQSVLTGRTKSCGCLNAQVRRSKPRKHGMCRTRTYNVWMHILRRCQNLKCFAYRWYGARGIKVCERWGKFENFLADMGECPPGRSIDRIDNDKGYEPGNCRWANRGEQARNTRRTIFITVDGERLCVKDWADRIGVKASAMYAARQRGVNLAKYITERASA